MWLTLNSIEKLRPKFKSPPLEVRPCPQCEELARAVRSGPEVDRSWDYQKTRFNSCSTCRKLRKVLEKVGDFRDCDDRGHLTGRIWYTIEPAEKDSSCWVLMLIDDDEEVQASVPLVREGRHANSQEGVGVRPNDHVIDISLIASWISRCDKTHAGACHSFQDPWAQVQPATDILLIDVDQHCLVPQRCVTGLVKYVALSYVWGKDDDPLRTLLSDVDSLSQPNAFLNHASRLPLTIRDSIALVSSLGLKYLWVDRFCIIQDNDPETKETQLAAMASIYANAYFTIAAREGDAHSGLAGSRPDVPRQKPFETFWLSPRCHMLLSCPTTYYDYMDEEYDHRAWTFQEWALSRRRLVFHNQTVSWVCASITEQENSIHPDRPTSTPHSDEFKSGIWTKSPQYGGYLWHVEGYSGRSLTYDTDKLRAFEAIMTVFGRCMKGRMLYGLPELFFPESLLWEDLSRGRNHTMIPSWSWAAWKGRIRTKLARIASECTDSPQSNDQGRRFHVIEMRMVLGETATGISEQIQDRAYWAKKSPRETDSSLTDDNILLSSVPVLEGPEDNMAKLSQHSPSFIRFSTERIRGFITTELPISTTRPSSRFDLRVLTYPDDPGPRTMTRLVCLCDEEDNIIGSLGPQQSLFPDPYVPSPGQRTGLDLICIGGLELEWNANTLHEAYYMHQECPWFAEYPDIPACAKDKSLCKLGPDWKFRFYNVLWVEWKDNIAYRKGIGKIWADCWEKLEREKIEVTLG